MDKLAMAEEQNRKGNKVKYQNRAARLKKLIDLSAPEEIVQNECFLLLLSIHELPTDDPTTAYLKAGERAIDAFKSFLIGDSLERVQ